MTSDNPNQDQGTFYAYDNAGRRIVAIKKSDRSILGEYMVPDASPWFYAVAGLFVIADPDGSNPILYWTEGGSLMRAYLNPSDAPAAGSTARPTFGAGSPKPSVSPSKKP